jgi:gluconate 5-dehydrogenase
MTDSESFNGQTVVITGASRGLGRVCAEAFAARGARVIATGRDEKALAALLERLPEGADRHRALTLDMLTDAGPAALAEAVLADGAPHVILHAMGGGYGFREPLLTAEEFQKLFLVNLGAAAEINRRLAPAMADAGHGRIIHVGSVASAEAIASVGYGTVKAALVGYVRSLGRALADGPVVVTGILPGAFFAPENAFRRLERNAPEAVAAFKRERLPRGVVGEAAELLPLLFLLAGPGAAMMAGTCVPIDAGEGRAFALP